VLRREVNGAEARRLIWTGQPGRSQATGFVDGSSLAADDGGEGDDGPRDGAWVGDCWAGLRRRYSGAGT
jgi:hypothetical protein